MTTSEYLTQLHGDCSGDLKKVATHLGISLKGLYKRLKSIGIRPRDLKQQLDKADRWRFDP